MKEPECNPVELKGLAKSRLSWRDTRYRRFYAVVDQLVNELQEHIRSATEKPKRRLKGDGLAQLT